MRFHHVHTFVVVMHIELFYFRCNHVHTWVVIMHEKTRRVFAAIRIVTTQLGVKVYSDLKARMHLHDITTESTHAPA